MAYAGSGGGKTFHDVHTLRSKSGWHAKHSDEQCIGDNAKGHSQSSIDELGSKTYGDEGKQGVKIETV